MFDHVTIRVSDLAASEAFHSTVLHTLGVEKAHTPGHVQFRFADGSFSFIEGTPR